MSKYIEAVKAAEIVSERHKIPLSELVDTFAEVPTADVIEVVRCKDCRHYEHFTEYNKHFCNEYGGYVVENDFCSRAEKKVSKNDK